jgi:hypothetical protein
MSDHSVLTVLVVPDCPNTAAATEHAHRALTATGIVATVRTVEVEDHDQAEALGFVGSPSFHLDGDDLFPTDSPPAIACRVYPTAAGLRGTPDLHDLSAALEAALR